MDDTDIHETKGDALEFAYWAAETGTSIFVCTTMKDDCPGKDLPDCPDCKGVEKTAGMTLAEFLVAINQTN